MPVRRIIVPIVCLALFMLMAYWINNTQPAASLGAPSEEPAMLVQTQILQAQPYALAVRSFGVVQAKYRNEINALVSGQVLQVSPAFRAGGRVLKGDVLLSLDTSDYELALQEARGNLANAELALAEEEARSEQAQRDWDSRKGSLQGSDFTLRRPQLKAAKENLVTAKARLKKAKLDLERCQVKATFSGRIQSTFVEQGSVVSPGLLLASAYDTSAAEIRLAVASDALQYLTVPQNSDSSGSTALPKGSAVRFTNTLVKPKQIWEGNITRSEAALDSATQQLYLVAEIAEPFALATQGSGSIQPLAIGQYLEAEIIGKRLDAVIVVPSSVIYQGRYVYLLEEGRLQRREVEVMWSSEEQSVLGKGVSPGDELIITALGQISSGTPVRTNINNVQIESKSGSIDAKGAVL